MRIHVFDDHDDTIKTENPDVRAGEGFYKLEIDDQLLRRAGKKLKISFTVDIIDIHGYWHPQKFRPSMKLDWNISFDSALQSNFPFITFFNQNHRNRFSAALSCVCDDVLIFAGMNQEFSYYEITMEVAVGDSTGAFDLLISTQDVNWTDIVAEYRNMLVGKLPEFPAGAWDPVYCTWYAAHAALSMDYLDRNASLCRELGFGTFIVDDGWCFDKSKRVTPETLRDWYCGVGDWTLSDRKLPGFTEHIERAQAMGLNYLLWVAPFFIGAESKAFARLEKMDSAFLAPIHEGRYVMDPAIPEAEEHSRNLMTALMEDLGLDGLKIDFLDSVPVSIEKPRGRVIKEYLDKLISALHSVKKDALIEFRQHYATPGMLPYATQFRAGDVPFDYLENIHRIAQIRIVLGDAVPVHADPVYFHEDELPMNVSRHMIASLAGVPMFSMDLGILKQMKLNIVKHWIGFYNRHIGTFRYGHWSIRYIYDHLAAASVDMPEERIVILLNENLLCEYSAGFPGNLHVLNLSNAELALPDAAGYDCEGNLTGNNIAPKGGRLLRQRN